MSLSVGIENLLVGNGSTELIHLLPRACLSQGNRCLIFSPTFGEYASASELAGAEVHFVHSHPAQSFNWPLCEALQAIEQLRPSVVFPCNPNNPTGVYLGSDYIAQLIEVVGAEELLVLDDAYVPFADGQWDSLSLFDSGNIAILRSMTKDHALAGLRLGYVVAHPKLISAVRKIQPAWSVNAVALAADVAALEDDSHVLAAGETIKKARAYLYRELRSLGISTTDSSANFLLAHVGDAARIRSALLRRRIAVRDCASFGLPVCIRIAVRKPEECTQLMSALRTVLGHD